MKTSKIIGAILMAISIFVGYIGINFFSDSTKQINFLGLKIDASSASGKQQGYIFLGLGILLLAGGIIAFGVKGQQNKS